MKTSEFKTMLDEMDLAVYESESAFIITEDELNWDIANVSKDYERIMNIEENAYEAIGSEQTCELFELLTAYASTPIVEREEPKKFRIKCPITGQFLNRSKWEDDSFSWRGNSFETPEYQPQFTRQDIEEYEFPMENLIEEEVTG